MSEEETEEKRVIKRFNPCPTKKTKESSPKKEKSFPWRVVLWMTLIVIAGTVVIKLWSSPSTTVTQTSTTSPPVTLTVKYTTAGQPCALPTYGRRFDWQAVLAEGNTKPTAFQVTFRDESGSIVKQPDRNGNLVSTRTYQPGEQDETEGYLWRWTHSAEYVSLGGGLNVKVWSYNN